MMTDAGLMNVDESDKNSTRNAAAMPLSHNAEIRRQTSGVEFL